MSKGRRFRTQGDQLAAADIEEQDTKGLQGPTVMAQVAAAKK